MIIKSAFSSCPNDTFIFGALINPLIDTGKLAFHPHIADVEELNLLALEGEADLVKISYAHFPAIAQNYLILNAGSALGFNCGPLIVTQNLKHAGDLENASIAVPGIHTTAFSLLNHFFPKRREIRPMIFSSIMDAVKSGTVDAGLIIHESRFTLHNSGLHALADLGTLWHHQTNLPLPLGCIAVHKKLPPNIIQAINLHMKQSVAFALKNPDVVMPFVRQYADSLDENVINAHIQLYVNDFTLEIGEIGKMAAYALWHHQFPNRDLFVDDWIRTSSSFL